MHDDVKARKGRRSRINAERKRDGRDVKNVHGKIERERERRRETEKVRETREEDIDKTRGE